MKHLKSLLSTLDTDRLNWISNTVSSNQSKTDVGLHKELIGIIEDKNSSAIAKGSAIYILSSLGIKKGIAPIAELITDHNFPDLNELRFLCTTPAAGLLKYGLKARPIILKLLEKENEFTQLRMFAIMILNIDQDKDKLNRLINKLKAEAKGKKATALKQLIKESKNWTA